MLVGSYKPLQIGERKVGPIMNTRIQKWEIMPYVVLEQVTEAEFAQYTLETHGFEIDSQFRGAYYYRISVD